MKNVNALFAVTGLLLVLSCAGSENGGNGNPSREEITFSGVGDYGIFDPCLAEDPDTGRIWMSYSEVDTSSYTANKKINTRLAYSDDSGTTWTDSGSVINAAADEAITIDSVSRNCTWENEVSSICYDPYAVAAERWKMVWHHYVAYNNGTEDVRDFRFGWIAMKSASTPENLAAATERVLFTGSGYALSGTLTPEVPLSSFVALSEPSIITANQALYVCMLGAISGTGGAIILLKYSYPSASGNVSTNTALWSYQGAFIVNDTDGPALDYDGLSAPSLYCKDGTYYLMATPEISDKYLGTMVFQVSSLDSATLVRASGVPQVVSSVFGTSGSHNGAAGYIPESSGSGIIYSELLIQLPLEFKIYASKVNP